MTMTSLGRLACAVRRTPGHLHATVADGDPGADSQYACISRASNGKLASNMASKQATEQALASHKSARTHMRTHALESGWAGRRAGLRSGARTISLTT